MMIPRGLKGRISVDDEEMRKERKEPKGS